MKNKHNTEEENLQNKSAANETEQPLAEEVKQLAEADLLKAIQVHEKHAREDAISAVKKAVVQKFEEEERDEARKKLCKLPRMSMEHRLNTRCEITGRPKAVLKKFKMSRLAFRDLANKGMIPGVTKSSW